MMLATSRSTKRKVVYGFSRCNIEDGEPYNNKVIVEKCIRGSWRAVEIYQATLFQTMRHLPLHVELVDWLDQQVVTSENIGNIRRSLFVPWESKWNSIVRDETAARENKP